DVDTQTRAKDVIEQALNPNKDSPSYTVAPNLVSLSPGWLSAIHSLPMYLGLDLRGGVHFMLQVNMEAALTKRLDGLAGSVRTALRDKNVRYAGIARERNGLVVRFRDAATRAQARGVIEASQPDLQLVDAGEGDDLRLVGSIKPEAASRIQSEALNQNIQILH